MDKIETYRENSFTSLIKAIVNAEIDKRIAQFKIDESDKYMTRSDVETFMEMDGFHYLSDDIDSAIGDYLRNQVTVELNC